MNPSRLFTASRIALVVTAMSFALRGAAASDWVAQFHLTHEQVGWVNGTAFWGFALAMTFGGPLCDTLGLGRILGFAFAGHLVGIALTLFAWNFWSLYIGTLVFGIANGSVEAACNPLVATLYPADRTAKLNQFHVWWPGGIILGSIVSYALAAAHIGWKAQFATMLIPLAIYGIMILGQEFPRTERVEKGVSTAGMFGACVNPWFLLMVLCMILTAATELGPGQWIPNILTNAGVPGILVLAWISGLMAVGRQYAGVFLHRASPLAILVAGSVLSCLGLYAMSHSHGPALFASATVFALGVCFFWPTMLGYVSEHFPRTGALGLAIMGGIGTLSVNFSLPAIGRIYDESVAAQVAAGQPDSPAVQAAAGLHALGMVALLPAILTVVFLALYFLRRDHREELRLMPSSDPTELPLHRLVPALERGAFSPVELVDAYLDRIRRLEPKLHAFVSLYEKEARLAAEAAAGAIKAGHRASPFHGVPIAIKDVIEIGGRVTTGGSKIWADRISPVTATLVRTLVGAGMIVLGKTHTVEFALGGWGTNQHMGAPWNPWDPKVARTPGGSSSGSGVAVAGRLAPCAIGTDTGGSVRLPSSFCGIVGLKTTVGRISTHGILPLAPTLDTPGPMARTVEDAAMLFQLLQQIDPLDPRTRIAPPCDPFPILKRGASGLVLAVLPAAEREGVDAEVLAAYDAAAEVLAKAGARLVEARLPATVAAYGQLSGDIMTTEGYAQVGHIAERDDLPTDQDVRPRFLQSRNRTAREYLHWLRDRDVKKREYAERFAGIDALLTPTTPFAALPLEAVDQKGSPARFTRMVNGLELCALAVPNGFTRAGLPTSLQIVAKGYDEATALRIGWAYEQATEWHDRRPPEI